MIVVARTNLVLFQAEGILRSVGSNLEPLTAIEREVGAAAGEALLARFEQTGELPLGGAVVTPGGDLEASFIVHVALQSYDEPVSEASVRKGLQNGLRAAARMGIETLALAPLGTGAGNLDAESSARVMLEVLREHMKTEDYPSQVTVAVATDYELETFSGLLAAPDAAEANSGE